MSSRAKAKRPSINADPEKVKMIRSGKKKKTITGFKEDQKIAYSNQTGKYIAVQKEVKVEEAGVTRQKKNFIEFESKLGTEIDTDLRKIAGPSLQPRQQRVEDRITIQKKRNDYLDNFQYKETKSFRKNPPKESIVVHNRKGRIYGGSSEEITSIQKMSNIRSNTVDKNTQKQNPNIRQNKSTSHLKNKPDTNSKTTATKTMTTTTKVGRRGGPTGAAQSETKTTTKTTKTTTTRSGGDTKTQTQTKTTSRTTRGKK